MGMHAAYPYQVLPWGTMQDYSQLVKTHREQDADITIATYSVPEREASQRGLVRQDPETGGSLVRTHAQHPLGLGTALLLPML